MTPNSNPTPSSTPSTAETDSRSTSSTPNGSGNSPDRSNGQVAPLSVTNSSPLAAENSNFTRENAIAHATDVQTRSLAGSQKPTSFVSAILLLAIVIMIVGLLFNSVWLGIAGATVALIVSLRVLWNSITKLFAQLLTEPLAIAVFGIVLAVICLLRFSSAGNRLATWYSGLNWDAVGASGEVIGAVGQILIAVLAVYIAWRQYIISKDLTIQQNLITQQQTIDSYFQGISELVLDAEGLLEDWPQERAIAEGRTAAILGSVDGAGKAKIIRFLSRSRLLSPLKRDRLLGRAILDGSGGYQEDRDFGVRVIDLGVMLAATNLVGTDLRWTDLSDANLIRADLTRADLVKVNFSRTILYDVSLAGSDLMGTRLFYGSHLTATPRNRTEVPDYVTGKYTGAVVENADFTNAQRMSEEQRYYCCAWGGSKTRATIPGGCEGIPNKLGR